MIAILCVDDDQDILDLCKINLERAGELEVVCRRSVREALPLIAQRDFAVIVADYRMPETDGIQMLKMLRAQGNEVPFILFTGQGREEIVIEAINSGADYYIPKGTNPKVLFAELNHRLDQALANYRMRNDLRESEELFRTMSAKANDAILLCASDGRIVFRNRVAIALFDLERRHGPFQDLVTVADRYQMDMGQALRQGAVDVPELVEATVPREGGDAYVEMSLSPIQVQGQKRVMVIARDVTERIQAQKEMALQLTELYNVTEILGQTTKELRRHEGLLRDANRELNLLASITRHDIRNKIVIMRGFIDLTRKENLPPRAAMYMERISQSAESISRQIEFTRIYKGLGTQLPTWQDAGAVMSTVTQQAAAPFPFEVDTKGVEIMADPLLDKVFLNLIENSLRHGGKVSRISLTVEAGPGESMRLIYQDNGDGIPPEELAKIFERGYGKDAGLGLFLSREILMLTGIDIAAKPSGKGARFEMLIPPGSWRQPA
jgi:PAS domain S-box-containing protein